MKTPIVISILVLGVASLAAAGEKHRASLSGAHEVPSISTTGLGELRLEISNDETSIDFTLSYCCLEAAPSMAHIHLGQQDVNGGVSVFFCGGPRPPCPPSGPTSVEVTGTIVATDVGGPAGQGIAAGELAELIRAIRAGITYANVHTATFPTGEIRGQIK